MPGQFSNFTKAFGKFFDYVKPIAETAWGYIGPILDGLGGISVGYDVFKNLNNLDDPNRSARDKAVDISKAVVAPLGLIPGPVGMVADKVADAFIDGTAYIQDVMEGKRDPPPMGADIHSGGLGDLPHEVLTNPYVKTFFNNFGYNRGGLGGGIF
jgi:hypothetical protein